jgi:TetR/AcrR family transcriptional regulator, repressor of fatR-cypB operon
VRHGERASSAGRREAGARAVLSVRDAVLDAALATFTERTYGGTSMSQVAERAGVAVGSIYRHFPSKEALGNGVYLTWKRRVIEDVEREVDPGAPTREAFGQLWRVLTRFATTYPDAFAFLEDQQHEEYLGDDGRALSDRMAAIAVDILVRGQRAGAVRPADPAVLLALAYGAFVGMAKAVRTGPLTSHDPFAEAEVAVWDMLRASS